MKNWNNIESVSVESREGSIKTYHTLYDALYSISWRIRDTDNVNRIGWIGRYFFNVYLHQPEKGCWIYSGDEYLLRDELGLLIPQWKIGKVWSSIPRNKYGWPVTYFDRRYRDFDFRNGPVPGVRCWKRGSRGARKLWQAVKADHYDKHDEELKEYKFKRRHYEDRFDKFFDWDRDHSDWRDRNWKRHRKTQWKS